MSNTKRSAGVMLLAAVCAAAFVNVARAGAREEGRLLTATEVLQEIRAMPDVRLPDTLLAHAYGIAVIPDVTKIAFIFGGRHGNGVLAVRDKLTSPWSNPVFVSLTGGSWGFQAGAQSSDIILVFTTKSGIEGIRHRGDCRRQADIGRGRFGRDRACRPARIRCDRHRFQRRDLQLRAHARLVRRNSLGRQCHFHRSVGEWLVLQQARRHGFRDIFRTGTGGSLDGAAFPRPAGPINRNCCEILARTSGRCAGNIRGTAERSAARR
jgi:hypothetical protein